MSDILCDLHQGMFTITMNRVSKHNAFDETILKTLYETLSEGIEHPQARVIILKANGKNFSAGADLQWMQRMSQYTEAQNIEDAQGLARVMHAFHISPKPTIAMIQGAAFGGGAGLAAACDIAIAADDARFCFSEVKLGLIPAVISPYVINAVGARAAQYLFMTAEVFSAVKALQLGLVHHCVSAPELEEFTRALALNITLNAPEAVQDCKTLVQQVRGQAIDDTLLKTTAQLIAKKRISTEGQEGLHAFLTKTTPKWQ